MRRDALRQFAWSTVIPVVICTFVAGCKPSTDTATNDSTSIADSAIEVQDDNAPAEEDEGQGGTDFIKYDGAEDNDVRKAMSTFLYLDRVLELSQISIDAKDRLEGEGQTEPLTKPSDSAVFRPSEIAAYNAIIEYEKLMAEGPVLKDRCPGLLELTRNTEADDSTSAILPPPGASALFEDGNFFFLGGNPFIQKIRKDDQDVFYNPEGKPESRFELQTENSLFLLNLICHKKKVKFTIEHGPPLPTYDFGPIEVNGIGSLVHRFVNRIPAVLITQRGPINGSLSAIDVKIAPQHLGCVDDAPAIEIACAEQVDYTEILGIVIPFGSNRISGGTVVQQGPLWTADLNSDGIADVACVTSSFLGEASGGDLFETLWFVNIHGEWKIIDWGEALDCT